LSMGDHRPEFPPIFWHHVPSIAWGFGWCFKPHKWVGIKFTKARLESEGHVGWGFGKHHQVCP
jgi:hypothetical protein